jgi:hypothetical protein
VNCFHFYFFLDIQGDFESGPDILTSGRNHFKKSLGATVFYEKNGLKNHSRHFRCHLIHK